MSLKNLAGIQQVYELTKKARAAQPKLSLYSQEQIDRIVAAMAKAGRDASEYLARLAAGETKLGRVESKIAKNRFAVEEVYESIQSLKTVGVIGYDEVQRCYEIAEPVGVIAAVIPMTNPTSTAMFKALIGIKSRNSVIFAPHPKAVRCIDEAVKVMRDAAIGAGAPEGCLECITEVSLDVTQELMKHPDVDFILATGGPGLVEAAYKSGKPAIGVGQGNTPVFIDRSAEIPHAVRCIVESQMFDFGTICSSEQSIIVDKPVVPQVMAEFKRQSAYFLSKEETEKITSVVMREGHMNPEVVGQPSHHIAKMAGIELPIQTTVLLAPLEGVGPDFPLSGEKLCPVLGFYEVGGWQEGCHRCVELLHYQGIGHTLGIHATNPDVIMEFGLQKPVSRIVVNAPTSQGGVGLATNLIPSFTLGCGTPGGNITSDNISAQHLYNIKRVAAVREDFPLWEKGRNIDEEVTRLKLQDVPATVFPVKAPENRGMASPKNETPPQVPSPVKPVAWEVRNYPAPRDFKSNPRSAKG